MSKAVYYSFEDLEKLKSELNQLITVERINISKQIAEARDKGDLSENAEYDAAKEAQGLLEMKISKLESKIASARVIDTSKLATDKVLLYSNVEIENMDNGSILKYLLVPDSESNIAEKKISISPCVLHSTPSRCSRARRRLSACSTSGLSARVIPLVASAACRLRASSQIITGVS